MLAPDATIPTAVDFLFTNQVAATVRSLALIHSLATGKLLTLRAGNKEECHPKALDEALRQPYHLVVAFTSPAFANRLA